MMSDYIILDFGLDLGTEIRNCLYQKLMAEHTQFLVVIKILICVLSCM